MGEVFAGPGYRSCSRAGCAWPAVSTAGFDYPRQSAWVEDLWPEHDPATYDLCSQHAERFSPPVGWDLHDRRSIPLAPIHPEPPPLVEDVIDPVAVTPKVSTAQII